MNDKNIVITVPLLTEKFDFFNKVYFGNKLKRPMLAINTTKTTLGCYKRDGRTNTDKILISNYYKATELELENTLIHEMIHAYQHQVLHDGGGHGKSFKMEAKRIGEESNGKYIISRCGSYKGGLSSDGAEKAARMDSKKPTIVLFKNIGDDGKEYIWFMRISDKMAHTLKTCPMMFETSMGLSLEGFIHGKPIDWMYQTNICRSRPTKGRKFLYKEFYEKHMNDIVPFIKR